MTFRFSVGGKKRRNQPKHLGEIVFIVIGGAIMLAAISTINKGELAPTIGAAAVGFFLALIGGVTLFDGVRKEKIRKKVIATGKKYTATVTGVQAVTRGRNMRRRKRYYCVECEMVDPETNEKYLYSSQYIRTNLYGSEGKQVTVYVDPDNRGNYFVDTGKLSEEMERNRPDKAQLIKEFGDRLNGS